MWQVRIGCVVTYVYATLEVVGRLFGKASKDSLCDTLHQTADVLHRKEKAGDIGDPTSISRP